jgi:hypothetical protein
VTDKLVVQKLEPATIHFFCFWRRMGSIIGRRHG